jgi:hypothetical protein
MFFVVFRKFDEYVAKDAAVPRLLERWMRENSDPNLFQVFSKCGSKVWCRKKANEFNYLSAAERARLGHDPYALLAWLDGSV